MVVSECPGDRTINLKLAIFGYQLLLSRCDPDKNFMHWCALHTSWDQAQNDLDRLEAMEQMARVNPGYLYKKPA